MRRPVCAIYANSKGASRPAHLRRLISAFVVIIDTLSKSWSSILWLSGRIGLGLVSPKPQKSGFLMTGLIVGIHRGDFDKINAPTIRKDILCFIR